MRISRPRDWTYMTAEEKQAWAEKTGKEIENAKKIVAERIKEMEKNGDFDKKDQVKHLEEPNNKMRWFPGGKF